MFPSRWSLPLAMFGERSEGLRSTSIDGGGGGGGDFLSDTSVN